MGYQIQQKKGNSIDLDNIKANSEHFESAEFKIPYDVFAVNILDEDGDVCGCLIYVPDISVKDTLSAN